MNLSSPVLYSQGPFSALNNRQLENDEKNEFNHECAASSVYRETMKALESWVNKMHLGKGEPVLTRDERLCEEGFTKKIQL